MTEPLRVLQVRSPQVLVQVHASAPVVRAQQPGLPGPTGPAGRDGAPGPPGLGGSGAISTDAGNALRVGSDGGLHCPAAVTATLHW